MRRSSRIVPFALSVAFLATAVFALLNWQDIFDWWRLRDYQAPPVIARLADETTMTPLGRKLFYVYYPSLEGKETFNQHCPGREQTIVLGCYAPTRGIYLFNVTDARLNGVMQVTAAHEVLHAAYDRLSASERQYVDSLVSQAFVGINDQRVKDTVEQYRAKDPGVVPNELHSILATEVHSLPPELESYYGRYFANRASIVAFSDKYEAEFTGRKQQIAAYDEQLKQLKRSVETAEVTLNAQSGQLTSERRRLDALLAAKNYDAYNNGVDGFNALVRQYNALVATTQANINKYNDLVKVRNALVVEEQDLAKSLDSRLETQAAH